MILGGRYGPTSHTIRANQRLRKMVGVSRCQKVHQACDLAASWTEKASGAFCVFVFATMTMVTLLGVFFRYVMLHPFQWTEELARYLFIWLAFGGINIALKRDEHIKIPFLSQHVPMKMAKIMDYTVDIAIGFFLLYLLKFGYFMAVNTTMTGSTFHIPMFWIFVSVPIAALLALIQLVLKIIIKITREFS